MRLTPFPPGNRRGPDGVESHMRLLVAVLSCAFISSCLAADPSLTIYNQQFAVVRETVPLNLKQGINRVEFSGATALLEPQSVMLRDPSGRHLLRVLEQNYRADPVSLAALLQRYEGQTIEFQVRNGDKVETVTGKIVRAGGAMQPMSGRVAYPNAYTMPVSYTHLTLPTKRIV